MQIPILIVAIETSCDETAVAVLKHTATETTVLSSIISSQIALHAPFGGVVPDLAAREHAKNILPVLKEALGEAHISKDDITALAVTSGPGLIPALLIGTAAAKTLAYVWKKPLLGIHHIEGHIYANFIHSHSQPSSNVSSFTAFPLLALIVSGGHTQIVLMRRHFQYEILGETQDDACGEAFDKVAKMLGLPYPGGPIVARYADAFDPSTSSHYDFHFPRPMLQSGDFQFSFSGLKTAVLYTIKNPENTRDKDFIGAICHEFQEAVLETLITKTKRALEKHRPKTFVIAGGVSANTALRSRLKALLEEDFPETTFLTPEFAYSLDNAAMIASAAAFRWNDYSDTERQSAHTAWETLSADSNLALQNRDATQ